MASQAPPSSEVGFPKYPDLPQDLRLQIIEHAIKASNRRDEPWSLTQLACIHSDWNRIIERILFESIRLNNKEFAQFADICGRRYGLLRRIQFTVLTGSLSPERVFVNSLVQLFRIMKGWDGADTKPDDLIKLDISVVIPEPWSAFGPIMPSPSSFSYGLGSLPEVSVISGMQIQSSTRAFALDHSYMNSLYAKLPNLHRAELKFDLPYQPLPKAMIDAASNRVHALHATKPSLRKLSFVLSTFALDFVRRVVGHDDRLTITRALIQLASLWRNSLVSLKIDCGMDVAQFLVAASDSTWPHLRKLKLMGTMGLYEDVSNGAVASNNMLAGLVVTLPRMPVLTKVDIRLYRSRTFYWDAQFRIDFNPTRETAGHGSHNLHSGYSQVIPCGSLPNSVGAIAKANHIALTGHLVTDLQDAVWNHRRLELAFFYCQKSVEEEDPNGVFIEPPCTIWNSSTDTWEPALANGMDMLIYDMGQYWLRMND